MKIYQLTYTAQVAIQDDVGFDDIAKDISCCLNKTYAGYILVDNEKAELESDDEIITS